METPVDICLVALDFLLALHPDRHLGKLVIAICCSVRILREVNVKPLGVLCIVVVHGPEHLNRLTVVVEEMKFR